MLTKSKVGPAAPLAFTTSLSARYTKDMVSSPTPEYIASSAQDAFLSLILDKNDKGSTKKLQAELSSPLSPMNEPAGKAIGFFEQGLFTGGGVVAVSALTGLAVALRYGAPAVMKRFR